MCVGETGTNCSLHHPAEAAAKQHFSQKSPIQADVSHSRNQTTPKGQGGIILTSHSKSPATLQQAARRSDAVAAAAWLQPLLPVPPSPRADGFDCGSAPAADRSEMALCTLHAPTPARMTQPHPGLPMPVILWKTRVTLVIWSQQHEAKCFGLPAAGSVAQSILTP